MPQWLSAFISLAAVTLIFYFAGQEQMIIAKGELVDNSRFASEAEMIRQLEIKKRDLEAEIFNLQIRNQEGGREFIQAKVYSLYPFTNRAEFIINAGTRRGVKVNAAVTVGKGTLVGRIKTVYQDISVVQTVFDPNFQIPVRIGEKEVDALFIGGLSPMATLIETPEAVKPDDLIVSAYREFPYGLVIGRVKEVLIDQLNPEVKIKPIYELKKIRDVLVVID